MELEACLKDEIEEKYINVESIQPKNMDDKEFELDELDKKI